MERCDFSSVITTIRKYISDDRNLNQIDLLYEMFVSFLSDDASQDFDFDNGLVCVSEREIEAVVEHDKSFASGKILMEMEEICRKRTAEIERLYYVANSIAM